MAETKENNRGQNMESYQDQEQANRNYMRTGVTYMGFSDKLHPLIADQMLKGVPEFQAKERKYYNNQDMDYVLDFKKSQKEGAKHYIWPGYTVTIANYPERTMFVPVYKNSGFTSKESANLLCGLAVYKEQKNAAGVSRGSWAELDFSLKDKDGQFVLNRYYANHGYDVENGLAELAKMTKKGELPDWIGHSLKKGNRPELVIEKDGREISCFLVANPKDKTIDVYEVNGNVLMRQEAISEQFKEKVEKKESRTMEKGGQNAFIQKMLENKFPNVMEADTGKSVTKTQPKAPIKRKPRKAIEAAGVKKKAGISR